MILGVRHFYRGFTPTMLGMIPYAGVSFYTYETLKKAASKYHFFMNSPNSDQLMSMNGPKLKPYVTLFVGALSGMIAQTCSYPFEVIRRQMQVSGTTGSYFTTAQTFNNILKNSGPRGLFVGLMIGYIKGMNLQFINSNADVRSFLLFVRIDQNFTEY